MFRTIKERLFFQHGLLRKLHLPRRPNLPRGVKVETREEGIQYITPIPAVAKK